MPLQTDQTTMKKKFHSNLQDHVHIGNVVSIVKQLLNIDICDCLIEHDPKFALEVKYLRDLLHRYRYATATERPPGLSAIEWVEQLGQELIQQTQHCMGYLTDTAQRELLHSIVFQTNTSNTRIRPL